jgi:1,2-diacylglycerol 3-beta-galactosyltransferase
MWLSGTIFVLFVIIDPSASNIFTAANIKPWQDRTRQFKDTVQKIFIVQPAKAEDTKSVEKPKSKKDDKKKRILILMSDTGGGHRASAKALERAIDEYYPNQIDIDIVDIWTDHSNWPFNQFVPTYRYLGKRPVLWRGFYAYGNFPPTKLFTEFWSWKNSFKSFESAILSANPDVVVSVHPLCQLMPISIVKKMNAKRDPSKRIPFVTIVTDLGGAHSTWFDKRVDACYVPSKEVEKIALANGVTPEKIHLHGLPIRPAFWKSANAKPQVRKELGLIDKIKTVLLMGGGDGVGGMDTIATTLCNTLEKLDQKTQLVVICGTNKKMADDLKSTLGKMKQIKVHVKGFCENIDAYMAASDCLVTKAGPGTIAEAMIRGLPVVLSYYLPGQEYGNIPYAVRGGFGIYTGSRPKSIAKSVQYLFTNDTALAIMSAEAQKEGHPEATKLIARDLGNIALKKFDFSNPNLG